MTNFDSLFFGHELENDVDHQFQSKVQNFFLRRTWFLIKVMNFSLQLQVLHLGKISIVLLFWVWVVQR